MLPARRHPLFLITACLTAACAGGPRPQAVTPAEIPALRTQAQQQPQNAEVRFRLAAAFLAADQCDSALLVVRAAQAMRPANVLGPMITGTCQEKGGRYDLAIATYNDFATRYPGARGVAAVRAKAQLALRVQAEQVARQALTREAELTRQPPEPSTLAVLPVTISGDTSLQPLSRGLAELLTSDLALIRTVRLLERLQISALLDELRLGESQRADPGTAARVGRLLRVERMVQGVAQMQRDGPVQLQASVVGPQGAVQPGRALSGRFRDLLDLEKQLVLNLGAQLGIQLTEAERQLILRQGPKNIAAFLAYSEGLTAMDRGDYAAAAAAFGRAVRADPGFTQAQQAQQAAQAAPTVQAAAPGEVVTVVSQVEQAAPPPEAPAAGALSSSTSDVAPTTGDAVAAATGGGGSTGGTTTQSNATTNSTGIGSVTTASGKIRIRFSRP